MSQLTGAQKASLIDALLSGYTSDEQLAELLDLHLDVRLAEIAQDGTLREQVYTVVTWAEAQGRTKELALQAQKLRPRNAPLARFVAAHYPGEGTQPPPFTPPPDTEPPLDTQPPRGSRQPANRRPLIYGVVAVAAILMVVLVVARPWGGRDGGGGNGKGTSGSDSSKERPRLPATLRFTELSGVATNQQPPRVVIDARFPPQQLTPGAALWFVIGTGPRCRERVHRAMVDNPELGYMTSMLALDRTRTTCAQLFVEDANGQTIARSDPREIAF
jgi:hypothetical protein